MDAMNVREGIEVWLHTFLTLASRTGHFIAGEERPR